MLDYIDLLFTVATVILLTSSIPTIKKLRKLTNSDAQSLLHSELHFIGLLLMLSGYCILHMPWSMTVSICEISLRFYIITLVRKKRQYKLTYPSDILYYSIKGVKKLYARL